MKCSILIMVITACNLVAFAAKDNSEVKYDFEVSAYDLVFELNASEKQFKSMQEIEIVNVSAEKVKHLYFLLQADLQIENISILNKRGKTLPIKGWEQVGSKQLYGNNLKIIRVQTAKNIAPGQKYRFLLEYQLQSAAIRDRISPEDQILDLTISSDASYAIGPTSGHFAIFNRNIAAPFSMTIKCPENQYCCAPGDLDKSEIIAGVKIETFSSETPKIPTFSCANYVKNARKVGKNTYEFYLYPGQIFDDEMIDIAAKIVGFYTDSFGDPGTNTYRFANVGALGSSFPPGLENKGNAIYLTDLLTQYYSQEDFAREMFIGLIAHEIFHNWNLYSLSWTGELMNWFEEGGANFVASWAVEELYGEKIANGGRMHFAESYDGGQGYKGYEAEQTLENATKDDMPSKMLMYYYGALVWEQLKQKVGDEAMLAGFSEFFRDNTFKTVTYQEFLIYLQKETDVHVEEYLSQWLNNNAKIDLSIGDVDIEQVGQHYRTEVEVLVDADRDYELISALGYKSSNQDKLELIEISFTQTGKHKVVFDSDYRPQFIQIDPAYRVPQINLTNNSWSE